MKHKSYHVQKSKSLHTSVVGLLIKANFVLGVSKHDSWFHDQMKDPSIWILQWWEGYEPFCENFFKRALKDKASNRKLEELEPLSSLQKQKATCWIEWIVCICWTPMSVLHTSWLFKIHHSTTYQSCHLYCRWSVTHQYHINLIIWYRQFLNLPFVPD